MQRGGVGGFTPWGGGVGGVGGIALWVIEGLAQHVLRSDVRRFLEFAEDQGRGFAAGVAVAGVGGEVAGQIGQAQPRGDLGLGLGDVQADPGDAADLAGGLLDLLAGDDVGQLFDGELVDVAHAEGVAVGVVEVGEDPGGGVGRGLGRGGVGGAGGDGTGGWCLGCVHGPKIPGGGGGSRGKGGMSMKRRTEAVIGDFFRWGCRRNGSNWL